MPAQKMTPLTPLPVPPNRRTDPPAVFSEKVQATVDAEKKMVDEFNQHIIPGYNSTVDPMNQVLANIADINTVAGIATDVTRVAQSADNVDRVKESIDKVDRVAQSANAVDRVQASIVNVDRVAQSANAIDRVHESIENVDTTATNMDAVVAAPTYAAEAKHWAEIAKDIVNIGPSTETESGIIRIATLDEVKAGTNGELAITPSTLHNRLKTAVNMAQTYFLANTGAF